MMMMMIAMVRTKDVKIMLVLRHIQRIYQTVTALPEGWMVTDPSRDWALPRDQDESQLPRVWFWSLLSS